MEARLSQIEGEKDRVWQAYLITGDEVKFRKEIEAVMLSIEKIGEQKLELEQRIEKAQQTTVDIERIEQACSLVKDNLGDATFQTKRLALETLGIRVCMDGNNVALEGAIPVMDSAIESNPS